MIIKEGVKIAGLQQEMQLALDVSQEAYKQILKELVITSAMRVKDKNSYHSKGLAIDLRINNLTYVQTDYVYNRIKKDLNSFGYDVVLEKDHIHIEFDYAKLIQ